MNKIELLIPAGDLSRCKTAIDFGADAVYIGGFAYSLRHRASNFSLDDIKEAVNYAHQRQRKIYVTVNMLFHDEDMIGIEDYLQQLNSIGCDAVITASPYLLSLKEKLGLQYQFHMSTQLSLLNSLDCAYFQNLGAERIVLARELSLTAIKALKEHSSIDLEVFVHGALCSNYSGRCILSNEMTGRDANRGGCAQSCRWDYNLFAEEKQINQEDCFFSLSSKDLCGLEYVPDLIACGIRSLKIEGRMKSAYYIAILTKAYREYIDLYYENPKEAKASLSYYLQEVAKAENRSTASGFLAGSVSCSGYLYQQESNFVNNQYVANVLDYDDEKKMVKIQVRNLIRPNDYLEVIEAKKDKEKFRFKVEKIYDEAMTEIEAANKPMMLAYLPVEFPLTSGAFIRKDNKDDI